jgi:uncharacterized protein YndB with AHSA1/START domain
MTTSTDSTVITNVYRVFIESTPERVWQAITDPEWNDKYAYRARSNYDLPSRRRLRRRRHARDGGARRTRRDHRRRGARVRPADRLVQTWHAYFDPATAAEPPTRLTWELRDVGNGMTELTLTHELENAPVTSRDHERSGAGRGGGFAWILSDLKTLLETGRAMGS